MLIRSLLSYLVFFLFFAQMLKLGNRVQFVCSASLSGILECSDLIFAFLVSVFSNFSFN